MMTQNKYQEMSMRLFGVPDISKRHEEVRVMKNVNKLTNNEWLFLHPTGYYTITYGTIIMALMICSGMGLLYRNDNSLVAVMFLILSFFLVLRLITKLKEHAIMRTYTLMDRYK